MMAQQHDCDFVSHLDLLVNFRNRAIKATRQRKAVMWKAMRARATIGEAMVPRMMYTEWKPSKFRNGQFSKVSFNFSLSQETLKKPGEWDLDFLAGGLS